MAPTRGLFSRLQVDHKALATTYGVGVGLYFRTLVWLRNAFLLAFLLAGIPYLVVINNARFTDVFHKGDPSHGITALAKSTGITTELAKTTFAAILEDSQDTTGSLSHLSVSFGGRHAGSIAKTTFLTGIALLDFAASLCLLVLGVVLALLADSFIKTMNGRSTEVSNYSVIVQGLPDDATHAEVGEHFSRYGRVMDVVLVRDVARLLQRCRHATALADKRSELQYRLESSSGHVAGTAADAARSATPTGQEQLKQQLQEVEAELQAAFAAMQAEPAAGKQQQQALLTAFVTFDTEEAMQASEQSCPQGWLARWPSSEPQHMLRGSCPLHVERALPPEDYVYENLAMPKSKKALGMAVSRLVLLLILVVSAIVIAVLQSQGNAQQELISWNGAKLTADVRAWRAADSSSAALGVEDYCRVCLPSSCSREVSALAGARVDFSYGSRVAYAKAMQGLLADGKVFQLLKQATAGSPNGSSATLGACLPCYCTGLGWANSQGDLQGDQLLAAKQECAQYISPLPSVRAFVVGVCISLTLVVVNKVLDAATLWIVKLQRHKSKSAEERVLALWSFTAQLVNSVAVLLVVSASFRSLSKVRVLTGSYDDFTQAWYQDVGFSVAVAFILELILTAVLPFCLMGGQRLINSSMKRVAPLARQESYNTLLQKGTFQLHRVSDVLVKMWVALIFGSGMPLLYLLGAAIFLAMDITQRRELARMNAAAVRYAGRNGERLPKLIVVHFPYAVAVHSAVGLWMHTYFRTGSGAEHGTGPAARSASERITQTNGYPLLLLFILAAVYLVLVRWLLLGVLMRWLRRSALFKRVLAMLPAGIAGDSAAAAIKPPTYREALEASCGSQAGHQLQGVPTYRLPQHPQYLSAFSNPVYKPLWRRACGSSSYTRLVYDEKYATFSVSEEVVTEQAEAADVESAINGLPYCVVTIARRLTSTKSEQAAQE